MKMIENNKPKWRDIRRKIKNGEELTAAEERKLDRWAFAWMFISIGVSFPLSIAALVLSLLTVLCKP